MPLAASLARPPRLARAAIAQLAALAAAVLIADRPWSAPPKPKEPERREPPKETRIRVIKLPKPPPRPPQPQSQQPQPQPQAQPQTPQVLPNRQVPKRQSAPRSQPASARTAESAVSRAIIAADSTAVQGVRLRVLVPRDPAELAAHLRGSGGCLVASRLSGGAAEVISTLRLDGDRAVETQGPPCAGVPRLLRDSGLNAALGDPLGRARAALPPNEQGGEVVLQVLLSPELHADARAALQARFGALPMAEIARRAAESGYELTCFAEPSGALRCE
jgi:hypothetical protein